MLVVYERLYYNYKTMPNYKLEVVPDSIATANDKAMLVIYQRPCCNYKAILDHKAVPNSTATANDEAAILVVY